MDDDTRSVSLGLAIMTLTGRGILAKAVRHLDKKIKMNTPPPPLQGNV